MEPFTTLCKSSDDNWLELRKTGIGASEMAAVLGESPYKSALELYLEKTTEVEKDDKPEEWKRWGNKLEKVIAEEYSERTGRNVELSGELIRSKRYPWAICTLDAWAYVDGVRIPLEIKTTSSFKADDWKDGPPEIYRIQCHHQMLVTDTSQASIACLIGGQRFVWCDIERDEMLINRIIGGGMCFWKRVQDKNPPAPDGSESSHRALSCMYPSDGVTERQLNGDFIDIDIELEEMKAEYETLGREIEKRKQQIQAAIGDAYFGVLPNGVIYTYLTSTRTEMTTKATTYRVLRRKAPKGRKP